MKNDLSDETFNELILFFLIILFLIISFIRIVQLFNLLQRCIILFVPTNE